MSVTYFRDTDTDPMGSRPHPAMALLENHWQSLRHGQNTPARADVDPAAIDKALSWTFILHRVAPGVARIRIAGQNLHDVLRMDPRGMPISAFFDADDRSTLSVHVESVFSDPALIMIPLHRPAALLRPEVQGALLLMPLTDHLGEVTRAIGAWSLTDPLGNVTACKLMAIYQCVMSHYQCIPLRPPSSKKGQATCAQPFVWSSITAKKLACFRRVQLVATRRKLLGNEEG